MACMHWACNIIQESEDEQVSLVPTDHEEDETPPGTTYTIPPEDYEITIKFEMVSSTFSLRVSKGHSSLWTCSCALWKAVKV